MGQTWIVNCVRWRTVACRQNFTNPGDAFCRYYQKERKTVHKWGLLNSMPRYQIGDRIKILSDGATPFAGLEGVIEDLRPHDRGVTVLDRYIVLFQWGERQTFYDVQLALVNPGVV